MKILRKLKSKDDAVSAVIGVILMVAITVAIAATVYVYVSGMIGTSPQQTPNLQLVKDSTNDKLTVASADPGNLKWSSFTISFNNSGWNDADLNAEETVTVDSDLKVNSTAGTIKAGHYLDLSTGTVDYSGTVTIRHDPTNTLIGTWDFN